MKNILLVALLTVVCTAPLSAQETERPSRREVVKERLDRNDDGEVGPRELHRAREKAHERRDRRQDRRDG